MNWEGPILDNHMHIDPLNGLGIDAVRHFSKAGGTHIMLVGKTARDWGINASSVEDFSLAYAKTIDLAEKIREGTGVIAYPVVGFHPAEFVGIASVKGLDYAIELGKDLACVWKDLHDETMIYAVGEVGRPHYPVSPEVWDASNMLLNYYFEWAKKEDVALQLHTEHFEIKEFEEMGKMIRGAGSPKRIIKHFSPPLPDIALEAGMHSSIVASRSSITEALKRSNEFFMETDYIDDSSRPGSVLGPKTVPKRTRQLCEAEIMADKDAYKIHVEVPNEVYGLGIE